MREILFRGKRADNGEWVEGYLIAPEFAPNKKYIGYLFADDAHDIDIAEVDPATLGQYTGLSDTNDNKIFEGDICYFTVFDCFDSDTQYHGVVVYSGSRFELWKTPESEYGSFDLDWVIDQDIEFEVIGNIHDNPELLKEEKQ